MKKLSKVREAVQDSVKKDQPLIKFNLNNNVQLETESRVLL